MISPLKIANIFKINKEWIDFEPETLWVLLRKEVGASSKSDLPEELKNMISAVRLCMSSDRPYKEWDVFENTALALNGEIPVVDMVQEIHFAEVVWAKMVMADLSKSEWSEDVKFYMANVAHKDGFISVPKSMKFMEKELIETSKAPKGMRDLVTKTYEKMGAKNPTKINEHSFVDVGCGKLWGVKKYIESKLGK